jgi:hypothetical protein
VYFPMSKLPEKMSFYRLFCALYLGIGFVQIFTIALSIGQVHIGQLCAILIMTVSGLAALGVSRYVSPPTGAEKEKDVCDPGLTPGATNMPPSTRAQANTAPSSSWTCKEFTPPKSDWNHILWLIPVIAAGIYLWLWVYAYRVPDISCDGNAYHLPAIKLWAQQGYINWVDPNFECSKFMNGYPKAAELISYLLVTATGDSNFANTCNLVFLPLGVLGIACISLSMGCSRAVSLAAGSLFVLVPLNIFQAATTYVDSAFASAAIAAIAAAVIYSSNDWNRRERIFNLVMIGAALGLALGIKSTGTALAVIIVGIVVTSEWLRTWPRSLRSLLATPPAGDHTGSPLQTMPPESENQPQIIRSTAPVFLVPVLICLVVGGYWYFRNFYYTGSPLYPAGVAVLGHQLLPGKPVQEIINCAGNTPMCMRNWHWASKIAAVWAQFGTNWPGTICSYDSRFGGLGFLWVLGCVPAVAVSLGTIKNKTLRRPYLILILITVLMFALTPMNWWPRYTLWIYGAGLAAFGIVLERLRASNFRLTAYTAAIVCLAAVAEAGVCIYKLPLNGHDEQAAIPFARLAGTKFEEIIDSNDAIAVGPLLSQADEMRWQVEIMGRLSIPVEKHRLIALGKNNDKHAVEELQKSGVRWIIWDQAVAIPDSVSKKSLRIYQDRVYGFLAIELKMP